MADKDKRIEISNEDLDPDPAPKRPKERIVILANELLAEEPQPFRPPNGNRNNPATRPTIDIGGQFQPDRAVALHYAGFWIRTMAALIDGVVLNIIAYALAVGLGMAMGITPDFFSKAILEGYFIIYFTALLTLIQLLYFSLSESSAYQATLGKRLLGIVVTDEQGRRISFLRAVGRYFAKLLSGLVLCIGFFMIAFTEKKQGLHDKLAGTLVVKKLS